MKLDKSILNLTLTEFNKSNINNLGNEVWKKINKELDTLYVLLAARSEKYNNLVYNYLDNKGYINN